MNILDVDLEHNLQFIHCLYKYVSVKTKNKQVHEGWLKTIDPLTGNIILVTFENDSFEMDHIIWITRETYEDISVVKDVDPIIKAALQKLYAGDTSHLETGVVGRKERLISWIKKHRLPFRETDDEKFSIPIKNLQKEVSKPTKDLDKGNGSSETTASFEEYYEMFLLIICLLSLATTCFYLHTYDYFVTPVMYMEQWPVTYIFDVILLFVLSVCQETIKEYFFKFPTTFTVIVILGCGIMLLACTIAGIIPKKYNSFAGNLTDVPPLIFHQNVQSDLWCTLT